jgi:hypothetical protein
MKLQGLFLGALLLLTTGFAHAATVTDNLDNGNNFSSVPAGLTFSGGHLNFTASSASNVNAQAYWNQTINYSATSDWSVQTVIHLDSFNSLSGNQDVNLSLNVYNGNNYLQVAIDRYVSNGSVVNDLFTNTSTGDLGETDGIDLTDVTLKISYNSSTGLTTASYLDSESNWQTLTTFSASDWTLTDGALLTLTLQGITYGTNSSSESAEVTEGQAYFDSVSVTSAAPEPTTYALIFLGGLVMLAGYRLRRHSNLC